MSQFETIRFHGEPVEVALASGVPMYRVSDVAALVGYSTASALIEATTSFVTTQSVPFVTRSYLAVDYTNLKVLLRQSRIPKVLREVVMKWFEGTYNDLAEKAEKNQGPKIASGKDFDYRMITVRGFLAANGIQLTPRKAQKLGLMCTKRRELLNLQKEVMDVHIEVTAKHTSGTAFVVREENLYQWHIITHCFKELTK